jgi:hypothetical protein
VSGTLHDTTRRYSRTLSEAFADERAHCIEGPVRSPIPYKAVSIALAIAFVVVVWSVVFQGAVK